MYPKVAPETVERIKTLTRDKFYDGLTFHRVIPGFMAQTGDPKGDGTGGSDLPDLPDEFSLRPHIRGTVSMANAGVPNSANSQFFIMFNDNRDLNGRYTVWGRVVDGMEFVDNIKKGNPAKDGAVEDDPDRIIRMRVMADVENEDSADATP
jgi:peptidylprolyl isomerase